MSKITTADVGQAGDGADPAHEVIDLIGGRLALVARMGNAESDAVLFRTSLAPGHGVPLHSHIDPECFYVLTGQLEVFLVDDAPRRYIVQAGQSMLAANGIRHAIRNPGDEAADLVVVTNNRLARFFREAGRLVRPGITFAAPGPEDIRHVAQVAHAYGYWLASPTESAAVTGQTLPQSRAEPPTRTAGV